jgi:glyoxylate/hydroxypyruvate reductase A
MEMSSIRSIEKLTSGIEGREVIFINDRPAGEIFHGVKYALVWKPDTRLFARLPDLEVIFSVGAGVDHIFACEDVPDVPIVRFVDRDLTTRMSEWICLQALSHLRQAPAYSRFQREHRWHELPQPQASEITIGIMGMGELGSDAAAKLSALGFRVIGWSRSGKSSREVAGVEMFNTHRLEAFLRQTHILIGLLPLTEDTLGIFNRKIFSLLKRHEEIASPIFINAGRGGSHSEADIVSCLMDGTLGGVSLDVFEEEPLDPDSPLWDLENVILTPHAAAVSDMANMARHVSAQIRRHEAGEPLQFLVDRDRGY